MKKYVLMLLVLVFCISLFSGCGGCQHEWTAANCTTPKTCELCGLTEGTAKGHIWEEATCIAPKKCSLCYQTEGQSLSHNWEEATTEAPKTCTNCQATEGSKLQTDPRFTTADTKHLHGKWTCDVIFTGELLDMPGYFDSVPCTMSYEFGKTGELITKVEIIDYFAFLDEFKRAITDMTYETLTQAGIGKEDADAAMQELYGMSMTEYIDYYMDSIDLDEIFDRFTESGVYYVGQNGFYVSNSWYGEFECMEYTLENDVLIMNAFAQKDGVLVVTEGDPEEDTEPLQWTRVSE